MLGQCRRSSEFIDNAFGLQMTETIDLLLTNRFPANFSSVRQQLLRIIAVSIQLTLATVGALLANGQSTSKACRKPPDIAAQPKMPEEYREKWKKVHLQGRVAIAIDEDGHILEAKLLEASPKEAADALLAAAKTITFKPRPGCGTFKTEMNFSVNQ
jgi:outer membrane biosynthesis protein TonB